jgi:hypothetical protein
VCTFSSQSPLHRQDRNSSGERVVGRYRPPAILRLWGPRDLTVRCTRPCPIGGSLAGHTEVLNRQHFTWTSALPSRGQDK